jgi:hypothetical protein
VSTGVDGIPSRPSITGMSWPRKGQSTFTIRHAAFARRSNQERDQRENAFEDKERTGRPTGSSMDGMIGLVIGARVQKAGLMDTFVSCIIAHHHFLIETLQIYKTLRADAPMKIATPLNQAQYQFRDDYQATPDEHEYRSNYPWTRRMAGSGDRDRPL